MLSVSVRQSIQLSVNIELMKINSTMQMSVYLQCVCVLSFIICFTAWRPILVNHSERVCAIACNCSDRRLYWRISTPTLLACVCRFSSMYHANRNEDREKHHFLIDNKITSSTIYRQETFHLNLRSLSLLSPHKLVRCMCHKLSSLQKNI